jgi:filamentous hemagglutinin family protein
MKPKTLLTTALLVIALPTPAQITTDGSLGPPQNLPGPDYQIGADLGQQRGGNLFHSFQDFNLQSFESATFSGPNHIQNVISRVTGGNPSNIDGLFRSTIPNADVYFLNPYGIVFGENAQLDVQGSFHASTADYLRLGEGGRFDVRNPSNSILTVAPIESFGFLDNPHGTIQVNGRGILNTESETPRALLQVPDGNSLSLIGGDIYLSQGLDELSLNNYPEEINPESTRATIKDEQRYSQLYAPSGTLNLASIQRAGEIALTRNGIHSPNMQGGTIQLEQEAFISTTGESGGNVFIRAGEFVMDNSHINAQTLGSLDGGLIDIQANNITLDNGSPIFGGTQNTGDGTDIRLTATNRLVLRNHSPLDTISGRLALLNETLGNAGYIRLQAHDIEINTDYSLNGIFSTDTYGTGRGGDLTMIAANRLDIVDAYIQVVTWGNMAPAGDSGNLSLVAKQLTIDYGGWVGTSSGGLGNAGWLQVDAESVYLGHLSGEFHSQLSTESYAQGNSGDIRIRAHDLLLEDGAYLDAANYGTGNGGNIDIALTGDFTARGASAATGRQTSIYASVYPDTDGHGGHSGDIHIQAQSLKLLDGAQIIAVSSAYNGNTRDAGTVILDIQGEVLLSGVNPYGENGSGFGSLIDVSSYGVHAGQAGRVQINAAAVEIRDGASIYTGSFAGSTSGGGEIQIHAGESIHIHGNASQIELQAPLSSQESYLSDSNPSYYNQSISGIYVENTSTAANSGDGGTIELSTPHLRLSQGGQISTASQGGGKAGRITLNVGTLQLDDRALIRSNSELNNQFSFTDAQSRDSQMLSLGTVVKIADVGDGRAVYQITFSDTLQNIMPITQVADMEALQALPEQINMAKNGDIVQVADNGNGQAARFIHTQYEFARQHWHRINENSRVVLTRHDVTLLNNNYSDASILPYSSGTLIHVEDVGNGKAADYVFVVNTFTEGPVIGSFQGDALRIKYYQVADMSELQTLTDSTDMFSGIQVDVANAQNGQPARLVFDGADWVRYGNVLEVPDIAAQEALTVAQSGYIARLPKGDSIYTGQAWIDLGETYRVNNLAERDHLPVQNGDLVKVADTGNGRHDAFLYADGQWIRQVRGGDAGQIVINADKIQLSDGSEISTSSISGGGGSITLNVDKMVYLTDSQVSTSVREGVGSGGDLTINGPQFVIMNNGKTIAQAYEGQGGNIHIVADQIVVSPNSLISASSKLGLDGRIEINAVDENVTEGMLSLSHKTVDASRLMKKSCDARNYQERENQGQFLVQPLTGSPASPHDLQPSRLPKMPTQTTSTKQSQQSKRITHQPYSVIASRCKPSPTQIKKIRTPVKKENHVVPEQLF